MGGLTYRYDLVRNLVRRDWLLRYHGSTFGMLWSLLFPLTQLAVLVFVFRRVLSLGIEAYPAFVFCALLPWAWFSSCLGSAGMLFLGNRDLVRRPEFPAPILVVVSTFSNLLTYVVSLPILLAVLVAYGRPPTRAVLVLPLLLLVQGALTIGLGLMIATLNVFFRDVQHLVTVALTLLFYLTPIFYRVDDPAHGSSWIFAANPIAVLIGSYRMILFDGVLPPWGGLAVIGAGSVLACAVGQAVYAHCQHDMIDVI